MATWRHTSPLYYFFGSFTFGCTKKSHREINGMRWEIADCSDPLKVRGPLITKFKMDISYYTSSSREWTPRKTQKSSTAFIQPANTLSFSSGFSRYPPKAARRFAFPFFAEVGAKRERMVTKRKGPWEGERLEVSPVFPLSPSFARKFSSRESRLGQQAAPEGARTRTLAGAFI